MKDKRITKAEGAGGLKSRQLIQSLFKKYFDNEYLNKLDDSAVLGRIDGKVVFTTDSHVVSPIFFPGGNIGKLAISGTVNDLCVMGAEPLFVSCGFIIEEGLEFSVLERVVKSMKDEANESGVKIVTGDTKVVGSGEADKLYINTSGIGVIRGKAELSIDRISPGDVVIINGTVGDHEASILIAREEFEISAEIKSDCTSLARLTTELISECKGIRFMRDPTRGGLATTLNEMVSGRGFGIKIYEKKVPVREAVRGLCDPLGFDPLYMACEGRVVVVVSKDEAERVVEIMNRYNWNDEPAIIGEVVDEPAGMVIMETEVGTERILDMITGVMLPRIC